ncbi:O-antigen ligase family protein [Candidatus Pacearchaeota archaeon]|nr:O-antigen ligase family protein [Candidatus Pacearchaeota archaeon]
MPRHIVWCVITIVAVLSAKDFRVGKLHLFALGYLGLVALSGVWAINKAEWMYWLSRVVLVVSFLTLEIDKKRLAKAMIILGVFFGIYFWYDFSQIHWYVNPFDACRGLMRQNNFWSAANYFIIPFCIYAIREKFWSKAAWAVVGLMVMNIVLLGSKTGYCALGVGVFVLLVLKNRWFVLSLVPIAVLCVVFREQIVAHDSIHLRLLQWKPTLAMILANPMGVGAGNWMVQFPNYARGLTYPGAFTDMFFRFPHNDYLWICAEMGFLGLFCFLGMIVCGLKKQAYLLVGILGYMAIACFSAPRERPFASLMLCVFLSLGCTRSAKLNLKWMVTPLLIVLIIMGFRLRSDIYNKSLRRAETLEQMAPLTAGFSVFSTLTEIGQPYYWWRGIALAEIDRQEAFDNLEKAYKYNPYSVQVLNGMGVVCMERKDLQGARAYFEEALDICPAYEIAKANLEKVR